MHPATVEKKYSTTSICKISRTITLRNILIPALICLGALSSACGYHIGGVLPRRTVAVPTFRNDTLYRGYEFALSRALTSEILLRTPLRVLDREHAETLLDGKITDIVITTVTKDEDRAATELDVTITAEFEWRNLRSGEVLVKKTRVSEKMEVNINRGEETEDAITRALKKIARAIIYHLEHPYWPKKTRKKEKKIDKTVTDNKDPIQ